MCKPWDVSAEIDYMLKSPEPDGFFWPGTGEWRYDSTNDTLGVGDIVYCNNWGYAKDKIF